MVIVLASTVDGVGIVLPGVEVEISVVVVVGVMGIVVAEILVVVAIEMTGVVVDSIGGGAV